MREQLRLFILDMYGYDIDSDQFSYSGNARSYIFNNGEITIRISGLGRYQFSREEKMAQMMWADDLALFKDTVCEPLPSKNGKMIETCYVGKWTINITAYRTPKGQLLTLSMMRPLFFVVLGDLMGGIHNTSMEQTNLGMHYKLPAFIDTIEDACKQASGIIANDIKGNIMKILDSVNALENTPETYGMCYNEFDGSNIIVDVNNPYIFYFDTSSYGFYLYDVATFVWDLLFFGYLPKASSKDVLYKHFLPWFSVGYRMNKPCTDKTFENIELFIQLQTAKVYLDYLLQDKDSNEERAQMLHKLTPVLLASDFFAAVNEYRKKHCS